MIKGCQKKIVFLKNTGSKLFDEAYFVISENDNSDKICDADLIVEANRIIDESVGYSDNNCKCNMIMRMIRFLKRVILPFFVGAVVATVFIIVFALLN